MSEHSTAEAMAEGWAFFQQADYFAAHEVWEDVWRSLPSGPAKELLQALIQWAVALHHGQTGNPIGEHRLRQKAFQRVAHLTDLPTNLEPIHQLLMDLLQKDLRGPSAIERMSPEAKHQLTSWLPKPL